jgi:predicted CopG family antitoxin
MSTENKNIDKEENPFPDEFNTKHVVGRPREIDYEEFQRLDREAIGEPLLSSDDIVDIIKENPSSTIRPQMKYSNISEIKEGEKNLFKADEAKEVIEFTNEELISPEYEVPASNSVQGEKFSEKHGKIHTQIIEPNVKLDENIEKEIQWFENTDEIGRDLDRMKKSFSDFIKAPKLTGNANGNTHVNLYSDEYIKSDESTVEILDSPNYSEMNRENSMIEINRDTNGEIISIVVYCKCGEKTVIKLDYYDPDFEELDDDNLNQQSKELSDITNEEVGDIGF